MGNVIVPYESENSIDIHRDVDLLIAREWVERNLKNILQEI